MANGDHVLTGSLAEIAEAMPCGFHDAELGSFHVDWPAERIVVAGTAWVAQNEPDPEVYRPFRLTIQGLRSLSVPAALGIDEGSRQLSLPVAGLRCDGHEGWPPDRQPAEPPLPNAWVYAWFLYELNDFLTLQAVDAAELAWTGPAVTA